MTDKPLPPITSVNAPYWEGTSIGKLRVQHCQACGNRFRFVSEWCPKCWSGNLRVDVVSGDGEVTAFSIVHLPPYEAFAGEVPYVLALVQLEDGPVMMSNIVDCDIRTVHVGMPVNVTYEDRGAIKLPQFRPRQAA